MSVTVKDRVMRDRATRGGLFGSWRWGGNALGFLGLFVFLVVLAQATLVVQARPQDLITGAHGMADILSRAMPPDFSKLPDELWPALETVDIAFFGTTAAVFL